MVVIRSVLFVGLILVTAGGRAAAQCPAGAGGPHHHHHGHAATRVDASPSPAPDNAPALTLAVPGIATFHPVTPTVALGSQTGPESMPALRSAGVKTVISFRVDGEEGFDREAMAASARQAGLAFVSIPFDGAHPDPAAVRRFLAVMSAPDTGPVYLSCHSGQRAALMWSLKRATDGWDLERALAEGRTLGLRKPELERFAREFAATAR